MFSSSWFKVGVPAAVLVVGGLLWIVQAPAEVQVATAPVTDGPMTRRIVATGALQAVTTVDVGAQVSGNIQSLAVDYNSFVHTNEIIARLDPSLYDAQLQAAKASLAQTEASMGQAQANVVGNQVSVLDAQTKLTRAQSLSTRQLIPQSDLDAARIAMDEATADLSAAAAGVKQAEAMVTQAKSAVGQAAVNLEHTIIRSPIDGVVINRSVDVGQTLASSMTAPVLFRIAADLTKMQVQVNVDESDVGALAVGELATFAVETFPGETFTGVVSQVRLQPVTESVTTGASNGATSTAAASAASTIVSYTAIVDVSNLDERLRPGMTAEVVLSGAQRDHVVRIPNNALSFRPPPEVLKAIGEVEPTITKEAGVREVWEYDGKRFTPIAVHAGLADGGWTELVSGAVRAGDALVTSAVVRRKSRM